jgi:hypothetical protein
MVQRCKVDIDNTDKKPAVQLSTWYIMMLLLGMTGCELQVPQEVRL